MSEHPFGSHIIAAITESGALIRAHVGGDGCTTFQWTGDAPARLEASLRSYLPTLASQLIPPSLPYFMEMLAAGQSHGDQPEQIFTIALGDFLSRILALPSGFEDDDTPGDNAD